MHSGLEPEMQNSSKGETHTLHAATPYLSNQLLPLLLVKLTGWAVLLLSLRSISLFLLSVGCRSVVWGGQGDRVMLCLCVKPPMDEPSDSLEAIILISRNTTLHLSLILSFRFLNTASLIHDSKTESLPIFKKSSKCICACEH